MNHYVPHQRSLFPDVDGAPQKGAGNSSRARLSAFASTLTLAMGTSSYMIFALGVLAPLITLDLKLSKASFGALVAVMFLVGGAVSPVAGWLVDAHGGRQILRVLFAFAALSLATAATAPTYALLLAAMALGGLALAASNPATNKLVAAHIRPGMQGVILGVKQSGVQIGAFLAGGLLPSGALLLGWRSVLLASAVLPVIGLAMTRLFVPLDLPMPSERGSTAWVRLWSRMASLVVYGFCMGLGVVVLAAYLPLYAHEAVGLSVSAAGVVAGTVGLVGIAARIVWGYASDRVTHLSALLAILAGGSVIFQIMLWAASPSRVVLLWIGAVGIGATASAWNVVGMLVIVKELGVQAAGRASGLVLLAFYGGFVTAPIAFGYSLDVTGTYDLGWANITLSYAAATAIATLRHIRRSRTVPHIAR